MASSSRRRLRGWVLVGACVGGDSSAAATAAVGASALVVAVAVAVVGTPEPLDIFVAVVLGCTLLSTSFPGVTSRLGLVYHADHRVLRRQDVKGRVQIRGGRGEQGVRIRIFLV